MLTPQPILSNRRNLVAILVAAAFGACSSDDADELALGPSNSLDVRSSGALVVVTERESSDGGSLHYLHVLSDWPSSGELDYSKATELGQPGVAFVQDHALYFYHAQAGKIEKITLDKDNKPVRGDEMSLAGRGITGFDAEPIRASAHKAFVVDEKTGQLVRWDPSKMEIDAVEQISGDVLKRDGLNLQFQLGVAAGKRVFTTASWRDWGTNTVAQVAALGVFEQDALDKGVTVLEDDRCAPSVSIGPFVDDDYVYLVSDGAQGYDLLASPKPVNKPQCVVRLHPDADAFDKDYFIDLQELTKSPAIYGAFPMREHKLLVHQWSSNEDVAKYKNTPDAAWFWDRPASYELVIVDLHDKTVTKVDLPLASARSSKTLIVDGDNYVQLFDAKKASTLYRVATDGKTTKVLTNEASTNVQFLGRL
jgi:hypothetical protein